MLSTIRTKIRALIEDFSKSDYQIFRYTNSNIFTLAEPNVTALGTVLINGNALESGESASYNSSNNKVTITGVSFNVGDTIEVNFTYNKYSDTELNEYIRASLSWLSVYDYSGGTFELGSSQISPTPSEKEQNMIAIVASILINPDWISYKLPNVSVTYPTPLPKDQKIKDVVQQFGGEESLGAVGVILWNKSCYDYEVKDFPLYVLKKTETKHLDLTINEGTKTTFVIEVHDDNDNIVDFSGGMIYVTVKENLEDEDSDLSTNDAVIQKDIDPTSPTTGKENIVLTEVDTDRTGSFYYDIKFVDTDGNHYILAKGKMSFEKSVTERA